MAAREIAHLLVALPFARRLACPPAEGPPVMIIPGFLADDRSTARLRRAFAEAGFRTAGWGLGLNRGVTADLLDRLIPGIEDFAAGGKATLVGWSLGGVFAREAARERPDLIDSVVTLGSPFSGDRRRNNAWRLYEWVAGHRVDRPPLDRPTFEKPPVPTLAIWSRRDGIVAPASARGADHESDAHVELGCTHMGFALDSAAAAAIVAAVAAFSAERAPPPRQEP